MFGWTPGCEWQGSWSSACASWERDGLNGVVGLCDDLDYSELEVMAQDAGLGLWSVSPPLERPWDVMEAAGGGAP